MFKKYRLFSAIFVHSSMPNIFGCMLLLCVWGSSLEHKIGTLRTIIIFFLCAFTANIYGLIVAVSLENVILGADGGCFGLLGASFGFIILNWLKINQPFLIKSMSLWCILIVFLFLMIFGSSMCSF